MRAASHPGPGIGQGRSPCHPGPPRPPIKRGWSPRPCGPQGTGCSNWSCPPAASRPGRRAARASGTCSRGTGPCPGACTTGRRGALRRPARTRWRGGRVGGEVQPMGERLDVEAGGRRRLLGHGMPLPGRDGLPVAGGHKTSLRPNWPKTLVFGHPADRFRNPWKSWDFAECPLRGFRPGARPELGRHLSSDSSPGMRGSSFSRGISLSFALSDRFCPVATGSPSWSAPRRRHGAARHRRGQGPTALPRASGRGRRNSPSRRRWAWLRQMDQIARERAVAAAGVLRADDDPKAPGPGGTTTSTAPDPSIPLSTGGVSSTA